MTKERLYFQSASEIVGSDDVCLLVLTDGQKERQLSIVSEKTIAVQLELRKCQLPISKIMLPEVLTNVIKNQANLEMELLITDLRNGVYIVSLMNLFTLEMVPIRASDAVLLSVAGDIPLYINSDLMRRQSVAYHANRAGVSLPVNTMTNEMLDKALEKAIRDENYELASYIRDERKRRE